MSISFLYTTLDDAKKAKKLAKKLVSEKLAACVNIIPKVESIYHYQGEIEQSEEVILLIKTPKNLVSWTRQFLESKHPYECPCIVEISIDSVNKLFSDWVIKETNPR